MQILLYCLYYNYLYGIIFFDRYFRYEFVNVPPEFGILSLCNEICPNDIVTHEWEFYSTVIGDYEFNIKCILLVMKDGIPIGPSICVPLHVVGKCEVGLLVVSYDVCICILKEKGLMFEIYNLTIGLII